MNSDKVSVLTAQVESLKEVVAVLENSKADEIARKWRAKLFEELIRNRKLQILHSQEIRGLRDEEQKLRAKDEELLGVLDNLQRQLSTANLDSQRTTGELAKAKQDLRREAETATKLSELLTGVPQQIASNLDVLAKLHSALDVFKQRVFIINSRVTTTKLLLRNLHKTQFSEFSYELEQLRKEAQKADRVTTEALAAKFEIDRLHGENAELQRMLRQLTSESQAQLQAVTERLGGRLKESEEANLSLKDTCDNLQADLERVSSEKKLVELREAELKETLERTKAELSLAKRQTEDSESETAAKISRLYEQFQQETQDKEEALDLLKKYKVKFEEQEQAYVALQTRSEESLAEESRYWQDEVKLKERLIRELKRERDSLLSVVESKAKTLNTSTQTEARTYTPVRTTTPSRRIESPGDKLPLLEELSKELLEGPI